jgi:hypothetical protein
LHLENTLSTHLPVINKVIMNYEKIFTIYILETYFYWQTSNFLHSPNEIKKFKGQKKFFAV